MSMKVSAYLIASLLTICASGVHADNRDHDRHDRNGRAEQRHHDDHRQHHREERYDRQSYARHDDRRAQNYDNHRGSERRDWQSHRSARPQQPRYDRYAHNRWDNGRYVVREYARPHYAAPRTSYRQYHQPRYRVAYYDRPYGYRPYNWYRGARLPVAYCAPRYIVYDYYDYGLRRPPYGYHWIRVDDDVVLAAVTTGIVLEVVNQIFW